MIINNLVNIHKAIRWMSSVLSMEIYRSGDGTFDLILLLSSNPIDNTKKMRVRFSEIKNLRLEKHIQLLYLSIKDISDRQWHRTRFEVTELEDGAISFLCYEINIEDN